jgi:hypothetical protein
MKMEGNKASNFFGGYDQWAKNFPLLNTIMHFLQWLTVPAETFLRRDFGQRYYTKINFYVGLLIMVWFNLLQEIGGIFGAIISGLNQRNYGEEISLIDRFFAKMPLLMLLAYIALGSYHFFKIRWRNHNGMYDHSFEDGTSRLTGLSSGFMDLVNAISQPISSLYMRFLSEKERRAGDKVPPLFNDLSAFTKGFFEPFFLFVLAIVLAVIGGGFISIWLIYSAFSLAIFSNWKETAKLNKLLDIRDNMVDSTDLQRAMKGEPTERITPAQQEIVAQIAAKTEESPAAAAQVKEDFPDLSSIIQQMHSKTKG